MLRASTLVEWHRALSAAITAQLCRPPWGFLGADGRRHLWLYQSPSFPRSDTTNCSRGVLWEPWTRRGVAQRHRRRDAVPGNFLAAAALQRPRYTGAAAATQPREAALICAVQALFCWDCECIAPISRT